MFASTFFKKIALTLLTISFITGSNHAVIIYPEQYKQSGITLNPSTTVIAFDVDEVMVSRKQFTKEKLQEWKQLIKEYPDKWSIGKTMVWLGYNCRTMLQNNKKMTLPQLIDWIAEHNPVMQQKTISGKSSAERIKDLITKGTPIETTIALLHDLHKRNYRIAIATNQDRYTFESLMRSGTVPENIYTVIYTKDYYPNKFMVKPHHDYYEGLKDALHEQQIDYSTLVFTDDRLKNVISAAQCGIIGIHYQNNEQLLNDLSQLGI